MDDARRCFRCQRGEVVPHCQDARCGWWTCALCGRVYHPRRGRFYDPTREVRRRWSVEYEDRPGTQGQVEDYPIRRPNRTRRQNRPIWGDRHNRPGNR